MVSTQTSPPLRFTTTMDAVVAAGLGKTVDVPVQAVEAGSAGNLPADTLVAFEEVNLGTSLAVTNPDPTTGGSDRTGAIQTAEDRSLVRQALLSELIAGCKTDLQQTLNPGDIYFPDTLAVSQVLSEAYFPAEGQSGDTLSLTMRLQCQVRYASVADVNVLGEMSLDANLPEGFVPASDGLAITASSTSSHECRRDHALGRSGGSPFAFPPGSAGSRATIPGSQTRKCPSATEGISATGWIACHLA